MPLIQLLVLAINILIVLIFIRAILSWVPRVSWQYRDITRWLDRITNPVIDPFRRIVPPFKTGGIDLSPLIAIIALQIIKRILWSIRPGPSPWN